MSEVYIPENISAQDIIDSLTKSNELQLRVRELGGTAILEAFMIIEKVIIAKDDNPSLLDTFYDNSPPPHKPALVYIGTGEARLNPDGYYRSAVLTVHSRSTNTTPDIELEIASSEDLH